MYLFCVILSTDWSSTNTLSTPPTARDVPDYIIVTEAVWQQEAQITTFQEAEQARIVPPKITLWQEVMVWEVPDVNMFLYYHLFKSACKA